MEKDLVEFVRKCHNQLFPVHAELIQLKARIKKIECDNFVPSESTSSYTTYAVSDITWCHVQNMSNNFSLSLYRGSTAVSDTWWF